MTAIPQMTYTIKRGSINIPLSGAERISFVSGYNQITGTYTSNIALDRFEIRITGVDEDHGIGLGKLAYQEVGTITANTPHNYSFTATTALFDKGDVTYRVELQARSTEDKTWDVTQFLITSESEPLVNQAGDYLHIYASGNY